MIKSLDLVGGGIAHYQYDAGKQRTRKYLERAVTNPDGTKRWVRHWERIYLGGYELYRRYNGNGTTLVEEIESHHLFEGEQRVLLVDDVITASGMANPRPDGLSVKKQTLFSYQYSNHLGSACLELDDQAEIISYEEYHPYGTAAYRAMKSGIEAPPKRYRYTGMERDEESGLSYHGARYYSTTLARWNAVDPTGCAGGINLYTYCLCQPTMHHDRQGTQPDQRDIPKLSDVDVDKANELKAFAKEVIKLLPKNEPLPRTAREKSKDVDVETEEHEKAVVAIINKTIDAAFADAKKRHVTLTKRELLYEALFTYVARVRRDKGAETSQNLALRDVDHYFAGRIQEWRKGLSYFDPLDFRPLYSFSTSSPLTTRPGLFAAEIYDYNKRSGFEAVPDRDAPDAKSGLEENDDPAAAPGGRLWAELGGEHAETRDSPGELVADPISLHIRPNDLKNLRIQKQEFLERFASKPDPNEERYPLLAVPKLFQRKLSLMPDYTLGH